MLQSSFPWSLSITWQVLPPHTEWRQETEREREWSSFHTFIPSLHKMLVSRPSWLSVYRLLHYFPQLFTLPCDFAVPPTTSRVHFPDPWLWVQPYTLIWLVGETSRGLKCTYQIGLTLLPFWHHHEKNMPNKAHWSSKNERYGAELPNHSTNCSLKQSPSTPADHKLQNENWILFVISHCLLGW